MPIPAEVEPTSMLIHGHRVTYRRAGSGPTLVLVHGVAGTSETWKGVIPALAQSFDVIAPDLLGHGDSAKPRGDYSLGAYASGIRDLLVALDLERATLVGHSLGGGVVMQFAYQFPERCERLALVSAGGLGREVSLLLRAATLPGAEYVLPLLTALGQTGAPIGRAINGLGLQAGPDLDEMWRSFSSLHDTETRQAFIHTLRSVVEPGGQRVNATDRLYLASEVPTLIVWGERDRIIPLPHAIAAQRAMPGARLETFPGAGHYPHLDEPRRFVQTLESWIAETEPAQLDPERLGRLLREGAPAV